MPVPIWDLLVWQNHGAHGLEHGDGMQGRLMKIADRLRESDVTGRLLATILVSSSRYTVWPIYLSLREAWGGFGFSPQYAWVVSAAYFGLCVWLVVLLTRNGKQYPGMVLDAICGGSLLAVAATLHQPPVRTALSQAGLDAAGWVVFLSASGLLLARSGQPHDVQSRQPR